MVFPVASLPHFEQSHVIPELCMSLGWVPGSAVPVLSTHSCHHAPDQSPSTQQSPGQGAPEGLGKSPFPFSGVFIPGNSIGRQGWHSRSHQVVPAALGFSNAAAHRDDTEGLIPTWSCCGNPKPLLCRRELTPLQCSGGKCRDAKAR